MQMQLPVLKRTAKVVHGKNDKLAIQYMGQEVTLEGAGAKLFDKGTKTVYPVSSHPVVAVHPWTGKKLLYVNRGQTTQINQLPRGESDAILNFLFDHIECPEWQMRFRWREHSIAFWDNRCAQHRAIWDYWPNIRSGYRIQIKGTQPPVPATA